MAKNRTKIESEDRNGDAKVLYLIDPDAKINKQAQLAYNRAFRDALQSGAILRQKLDDVLRDQEIWDDKKEARYNEIIRTEKHPLPLSSGQNSCTFFIIVLTLSTSGNEAQCPIAS